MIYGLCVLYEGLDFTKMRSYKKVTIGSFGVILVITVMYMLYMIRTDSADGRLLLWKISSSMVMDLPVFGRSPVLFIQI